MNIYANQRSASRNQSTVDYNAQNVFTYGNRFTKGLLVNNLGESIDAQDGFLLVRNSGTLETATAKFVALTIGQTMIIGGLTYTSTGASTATQVATAFANLAAGATTGAGTATGSYSGTFGAYTTGAVHGTLSDSVLFTATTVGNKTDLAATGTGTAPTIVVINGTSGSADGFSPCTRANLANVIGILKLEGVNTLADGATLSANMCIDGDIDATNLILPDGVTLDTIVGSKALKDILTSQGFVLNNVIEGTKYNN